MSPMPWNDHEDEYDVPEDMPGYWEGYESYENLEDETDDYERIWRERHADKEMWDRWEDSYSGDIFDIRLPHIDEIIYPEDERND